MAEFRAEAGEPDRNRTGSDQMVRGRSRAFFLAETCSEQAYSSPIPTPYWWAHSAFTRINIELTIQKNQIEDNPEVL
jgi:hypothetical protein